MSGTAIGYETYLPAGSDLPEHVLTIGSRAGVPLLLIGTLFEEANFTRKLLVDLGRRLAAMDVGVWIPDLPGAGESRRGLDTVAWADWTAAIAGASAHVRQATGRVPHVASIRGGALLDGAAVAASRWRFAPANGADLLRQMRRAQSLTDKEAGGAPPATPGIVSLVGYRLSDALATALQDAVPSSGEPLRSVASPAGSAPLWRRAEPGHDAALADMLATDLRDWIAACAA